MGTQARLIVVGMDGSSSSMAALEWAARQAELTHSAVEAVTTWHWPTSYGYAVPLASEFNPATEATKVAGAAVAATRQRHPDIDTRLSVVEGYAAQVLVDRSKDAELLVVGSRGHSELAGMLLGSVSEHCVSHAHCPVLVLRA